MQNYIYPQPKGPENLKEVVGLLIEYLDLALVLLMGVAIVLFVWYIIKYFITPNDSGEGRKQAGLYLMYSVFGFAIILSFWGLVFIVQNSLGLSSHDTPSSWSSFTNIFPKK